MIYPANNGRSNQTQSRSSNTTGEQSSGGERHDEEGSSSTVIGRSIKSTPTASIMIQQRVSTSSSSGVLTTGSSAGRSSCPSTRSHSLSSSPAPGMIAPSSLGVIYGSSSFAAQGSGSLAGILSTSPSYEYNTANYSDSQEDYDDQYDHFYEPPKNNLYHSTNEKQMLVSMDGYYFTNKPVNPVSCFLFLISKVKYIFYLENNFNHRYNNYNCIIYPVLRNVT